MEVKKLITLCFNECKNSFNFILDINIDNNRYDWDTEQNLRKKLSNFEFFKLFKKIFYFICCLAINKFLWIVEKKIKLKK